MKAHNFWNHICRTVEERLEIDPTNFYDWPEIRHTMLVHNAPWIFEEMSYLLKDNYMKTWSWILPDDTLADHLKISNVTTENTIHHCYSLARWQNFTGKKIADLDSIVEFGAGYGNTCRLIRKMGFEGTYTIIDLPAFQKLQKYYLEVNGVEGVEWKDIENIPPCDLFIAQWSLSEIPIEERHKVLKTDKQHLLLAFQHHFEDIDNLSYFQELQPIPITHIPGNSYFFK